MPTDLTELRERTTSLMDSIKACRLQIKEAYEKAIAENDEVMRSANAELTRIDQLILQSRACKSP